MCSTRWDEYIKDVNADPFVQTNTIGKGLRFKLLNNQVKPHVHQAEWSEVVKALKNSSLRP